MKKMQSVFFITMIAALGGFLFGFDIAVVSGIIGPIKQQFNLSSPAEGWFVSCALLGCIIGVAISGYLSDRIGRKKVLLLAAFLFFISAIGFALAHTYPMIILFRIMAGIGIGVASNISPLYISEISPARNRGSLVTFYQLAITVGILAAYLSNYFLQRYATAASLSPGTSSSFFHWLFITELWRGMFIVGGIPALLFFVLILFVPESPRWLMQHNRHEQAKNILNNIHGSEEGQNEAVAILSVLHQNEGGFSALFKPPVRALLIMAMVLTALSQFSGINGVIYYGPTILKSAGIVTSDALWYQVILGISNTVFTCVAIWKVDSWGRRPLYIVGSIAATLALASTAICFIIGITGWALLFCVIAFLFAFAFSLGPLKFVIATEIFPIHIRGRALSICIMTMWIADWFVNILFPLMRDGLGIAITFSIFAFFCLLSFLYAKKNLMETKGKSLEEIEQELASNDNKSHTKKATVQPNL